MKIATSAFLLLVIVCFSPASAQSDAESGDDPAPKSVDRGRDNSLDDELLEGLADETVEGLDGTKDVKLEGQQDPLANISGRMREVEQSIAEADAGEGTQGKQREIAEEMQKLIRQLQKQCQACKQGSSKRQKSAGRGKVAQPDQANQPSDQPARDSSDRLNDEKITKPDAAAMREMAKAAWGHLPEHLREQMTQSPTLEFLPEYLLLIEDYYKALAKSSEKDRK